MCPDDIFACLAVFNVKSDIPCKIIAGKRNVFSERHRANAKAFRSHIGVTASGNIDIITYVFHFKLADPGMCHLLTDCAKYGCSQACGEADRAIFYLMPLSEFIAYQVD